MNIGVFDLWDWEGLIVHSLRPRLVIEVRSEIREEEDDLYYSLGIL